MERTGRVLHFSAGARRFALPLSMVREIAEIRRCETVPGAPAVVAGLAEVRGRVVTLLSLAPSEGPHETAETPLLAVLLAEPLGHLGVLVYGGPSAVEADAGVGEILGPQPDWSTGPATVEEHAERPPGREVLVSGGRRAVMIDPVGLAAYCTRKVRETFKVAR